MISEERRTKNAGPTQESNRAADGSTRDPQGPKGTSNRRRWGMRLAAATLVPLLVLSALELGLRIAGYGYSTRFLVPSRIDGQDFLIPDNRFSYRFFPQSMARWPVAFRLLAKKPAGTYRIFLFGESAAFGDPDPSFGVGRYLEVLLEERYPPTDFEVLPIALTAINSHAILPMARECAHHDGDLWIVYMGNNEMVGPYGAGTVFGTRAPPMGLVRSILAIKTTRVGQLLDALVAGVRSGSASPQTWTGIDMFRENQLRHDDPARLRTYENFRINLEDILEIGFGEDVPILVSTVASNTKDCSPFASLHAGDLDPTRLGEWEELYEEGVALQNAGAYQAAVAAYSNAAAIDPEFAELQFRLGTCHLALTNRDHALKAFQLARDYDALAVRADSHINRIIMETVAQHEGGTVIPVDAARALAEASPEGISGREWFYEHVHFTMEGNYQLARVFARELETVLPPEITESAADGWADQVLCDRHLAATLFDKQRLWRDTSKRMTRPPFAEQANQADNLQYCEDRLQALLSQDTPETPQHTRALYEEALAQRPDDNLLRGNYARFLAATGSSSEAIVQGKLICELLPDMPWPHCFVALLLEGEGRTGEAADYFEQALEIQDDFTWARDQLRRLELSQPKLGTPIR